MFLVKKICLFSQMEFSRGLVLLVMEKMLADVPELVYDDHQFSHFLDEALAFDKELRGMFGGSSPPSCLHVLTLDEPFNKWILIERKCKFFSLWLAILDSTSWNNKNAGV